jgi:glycerophosphoryl diester phosphodiesterase
VGKITPECIAEAKALSEKVWLSPCYDDNDEESIKLAIDAGIGVSFWTVDTVEDAKRLFNMGVKYIETDILCK